MSPKSLLWLSISASLDLNRWEDRQNLSNSNPISVQESEAYFQNNSLTPYQQERFRYSMEQTASVSYIESVLDSKGSRNSRPISMRIAALKALDAKSSPDSLAALWEIYVRSRFRDLQEDPDLFERALRTIIKIESLHPNSNRPHIEKTLPQLVKAYVGSTQSESIAPYLQACYEQHRVECIRAFQSHRGSLLLSFLESPPVSISPLPLPQPPGQWEDEAPPQKSNVEIRTFSPSLTIPKSLVVGFLTLAFVFLSRRHRWQKYAAIGLGLTVFLWIEVFLEWIEHPTLAEQQPLFSFIDWKYEPYQFIRRDSDEWWVSEGGPARWQEVRASGETFTIATLGASSAHGSNLLQEETFSALLASRLQRENPSQSLQILNFGIGGTTSNGVLYSGKQALSMGADALIIYYGHNEVPQFHQLSTFEGTSYLSLRLLFSHIRLYEILHRFLPSSSSSSSQPIYLSRQRVQELAITNHR
ncbi:MAG: SGNH/GDSL hydrolase family protein, partial [Myxococcota bacterium]|nr:SGNH/GDSL hydrolase family protein [Myxococcota bacterium]